MNNELINITELYETENQDHSIINLSELWITLNSFPDYTIRLYPVSNLDYTIVDRNEINENLFKLIEYNLNYIILTKLFHEKKYINLYLTPIVKSA